MRVSTHHLDSKGVHEIAVRPDEAIVVLGTNLLELLSNLEHPEAYLADAARELPPRPRDSANFVRVRARTVSVSSSLAQSSL